MNSTTLTQAELFALSDPIDVAFVFTCLCFAVPIIPAVGLGYSGYSTHRNGLASFYPALISLSVCSVQWWTIGYTLAFGTAGNPVFGGFDNFLHKGVDATPVGTIPAILFSAFQLAFQATVCAIVLGGACERGRLLPLVPFCFLWATLVYCPLAHMVWDASGFLAQFARLCWWNTGSYLLWSQCNSNVCIPLSSSIPISQVGFSDAFSSQTTPTSQYHEPSVFDISPPYRSQSNIDVLELLAMVGIWTGWLAFEAGTALSLNYKAVFAVFTTHLAASTGMIAWVLLDYRVTGQFSLDSSFLGAIAGLVVITPSAGFVGIGSAFTMAILSVLVCRTALKIKFTEFARRIRWVDNGDSFATHCVGGIFATLATGLFASREVAAYDGATEIYGGVFFDGNIAQIGVQLVEAIIGFTWSFGVSYAIYAGLDCIPGLEVLATDKGVREGMDRCQMDESLYEAQWEDEVDYTPFKDGEITLD